MEGDWFLAQCGWAPYKKRRDPETHPEEKATVRPEAKTGVLQRPARTPGTGSRQRKLGRRQRGFGSLRGARPCCHLAFRLPASRKCGRMNSCCCKPPSQWRLVTGASTDHPPQQDHRSPHPTLGAMVREGWGLT